MGSEQNRLTDLLLEAFAEGVPEGIAMQRCIQALRDLKPDEQLQIELPSPASDLQLFEYIMRQGGVLLLLLERKKV